ncbi:MAG: hypothetical protein ACI9R3_001323 [Verrucomicrobiales bacterium]|jgi:hypothetical protein
MTRSRALLALGFALALPSCDDAPQKTPQAVANLSPEEIPSGTKIEAAMDVALLSGGLQHWRVLDEIPANAGVEFTSDDSCRLPAGEPFSAIRYEGPWDLPVTDYEITYDARRIEGADFFAALTFPVNSLKTCATFIPGGWGGSVTGISCIDGINASANETTSTFNYAVDQWYTFRIEVRPDMMKVWNGTAIIAKVPLAGKTISLRPGDIEHCAPLGLSSYMTTGDVRNLKIRSLNGEPLWRRHVN